MLIIRETQYKEVIVFTWTCDMVEEQNLDELMTQDKLFAYRKIDMHWWFSQIK